MSTIKKQFVEVFKILEANKGMKVESILDQLLPLMTSKKNETTYVMDENNQPFAIYCWYHKQWELLSEIEYGSKSNTKTGLSTMCKIGTSKWTKAQRDATLANANILADVASGKLEPSKILDKQAEIELQRTTMDTTDMPKCITQEALNKKITTINNKIKAK